MRRAVGQGEESTSSRADIVRIDQGNLSIFPCSHLEGVHLVRGSVSRDGMGDEPKDGSREDVRSKRGDLEALEGGSLKHGLDRPVRSAVEDGACWTDVGTEGRDPDDVLDVGLQEGVEEQGFVGELLASDMRCDEAFDDVSLLESSGVDLKPVLGLYLDERKLGQLLGRIAVGRPSEAQDMDVLACESG